MTKWSAILTRTEHPDTIRSVLIYLLKAEAFQWRMRSPQSSSLGVVVLIYVSAMAAGDESGHFVRKMTDTSASRGVAIIRYESSGDALQLETVVVRGAKTANHPFCSHLS